MESQKKHQLVFSFEFYPPKTDEGVIKLRKAREELAQVHPSFFSVTFGAGGSTRQRTFETVVEIQQAHLHAAPHISCIDSTCEKIRELLQVYLAHGVRRLVALRGDLPAGMTDPGELKHANELVQFIRAETGNAFHIEVAAYPEFHPEAPNAQVDMENFRRKVEAGANSALTQYFYHAEAYYRFVESCEAMHLDLPIVPGIMPITHYLQLVRFSEKCGAEIPRWLRKRLENFGDDESSLRSFGLDVTTALCRELLDNGAPGLHFYTLNQAGPTLGIWSNLGLGVLPVADDDEDHVWDL